MSLHGEKCRNLIIVSSPNCNPAIVHHHDSWPLTMCPTGHVNSFLAACGSMKMCEMLREIAATIEAGLGEVSWRRNSG